MSVLIPLTNFECLSLIQHVALGVGVDTSQRAWHLNLGSVWRHCADCGAGISQ